MQPTASQATPNQPNAGMTMTAARVSENSTQRTQQGHCEHRASHIRGGGVAKDCFIGAIGIFFCFEFCQGCCDCVADIICCPCEMCC